MTDTQSSPHRIRQRRTQLGLTQAELAARAGISRTAVTAIEGQRLVPSVESALALAAALGTTVEELFGHPSSTPPAEIRAWAPLTDNSRYWRAEVSGKTILYPASSLPMMSLVPDRTAAGDNRSASVSASETLVLACCDPAAGLLASHFNAVTGLRLIVLPRSSRQSLEMLHAGLVHMAGLHFATRESPHANTQAVQAALGSGYQFLRLARWQEGIALAPTVQGRSVRSVTKAKLTWIGREAGSGARQCFDQLFEHRVTPRRVARDHGGVVEAVRSGWADAGVCVQLACAEAGLSFLPVQEEAFDICFSSAFADDRRLKAFLSVIRSTDYRHQLSELPGYDTHETGHLWEVKV